MLLTCVEARLQSDERKLFEIWTLSAGGWLSAETLEKYQHIFPRDLHVLDACSSEGHPADTGPCTVDWESSALHFRPSSAQNTDNMQVCKRQKHLKHTRTEPVQQAQPVDLFRSVAVARFNTPAIWGCEINLADTPDWWIWSCSAVPTSLKNKCNNKSVSTYIWPRKATTCDLMASWCWCVIPQQEQKVLPVLRRYLPKQKSRLESADRVCQVFWQHGGLKSFSCVSERHNRNQTDQSHMVGAILTRLPPSEGLYRHACCYLPVMVLCLGIQTWVGGLGYELRQSRWSRGGSLFLAVAPRKSKVSYMILWRRVDLQHLTLDICIYTLVQWCLL